MVCLPEPTAMPKIVHLYMGMFNPRAHLAALTETASLHELVLIGTSYLMVGGRLAVLREALAPCRMVALLVDDDLPPVEQALVDDLLNDGVIPVIVVVGDAPTPALMSWLDNHEPSADSAGHCHEHHRIAGPALRLRPHRWVVSRNDTDDLHPAG
jgi:hypothetical protein